MLSAVCQYQPSSREATLVAALSADRAAAAELREQIEQFSPELLAQIDVTEDHSSLTVITKGRLRLYHIGHPARAGRGEHDSYWLGSDGNHYRGTSLQVQKLKLHKLNHWTLESILKGMRLTYVALPRELVTTP